MTSLNSFRNSTASRSSLPPYSFGTHSPVLARVVEVEHRGHGVDADAVGVELLEPEQRVGDEEVADLVAPVVEDQRAPVGVRAAARVGVLVERGAVEAGEREVVAREVRRDPVEDHADAVLVQAVDELAQVVGRAEARRRGEVARHLVAPGARERVRHHRQQLDVGEAHVLGVGAQLVGQLEVGQRPVALERVQPPRAEMDLVDRHRAVERADSRAARRATPRRPTRAAGRGRRCAVLGGTSVSNATGSAFRRISPSGARISYL